ARSAGGEEGMGTKWMGIHGGRRTRKKGLEKLTSADEILGYRVGCEQE
ncbi:DUF4376 domain-containing protein, partial [Escherichia coli]